VKDSNDSSHENLKIYLTNDGDSCIAIAPQAIKYCIRILIPMAIKTSPSQLIGPDIAGGKS
jgi:hypothetical protein